MEQNSVTIVRDHDKVCILEQLLNYDRELEKIVSDYIDKSIHKQCKMECFHKIKHKIDNIIVLSKILQICSSIAFDTPLQIDIDEIRNIDEFRNIDNIIKYIDNPYLPLFG